MLVETEQVYANPLRVAMLDVVGQLLIAGEIASNSA